MKTISSIIVLLPIAAAALTAQAINPYPDISILESNERGITLEYRPRFIEDDVIATESGEWKRPRVHFAYRSHTQRPGSEELLARVIKLAVPGYTGHRVTVLAADYETVAGYPLAPVPQQTMIDNLGAVKKTYTPEFGSTSGFSPASVATLDNPGNVKGWLLANLILSPYQFQSSNSELRKYRRIVVRVDFGPRTAVFDGTGDWASASLLNFEAGVRWVGKGIKKSTAASSVMATGTWFKLEVAEEGMYKIDAAYLRSLGVDVSGLASITDIKIFGSDGRILPVQVITPRPGDLPQIAVHYIDNDADNRFDDDDYLLFYAQGTTGWDYDPFQKSFSHYINPYTNNNVYFLAVGPSAPVLKTGLRTVPSPGTVPVTQTTGMAFFKEEKANVNLSGQNWVSAPFNANDSRVISTKLTGYIDGTPVTYVYHFYSRSNVTTTFTLEESGTPIASLSIWGMSEETLNWPAAPYALEDANSVTVVPPIADQRSNLKITYQASSTSSLGYINWIRIFYRQQLTAENGEIVFTAPDAAGTVQFSLDGFPSNDIRVFDVTNVRQQAIVTHQLSQAMGTITFSDSLKQGSVKKYWAGIPAAYKTPRAAVRIPNSDLHGFEGAEFIIITHKEFKSEAERLKSHKESLARPLSTVVVDIDSILNEFGSGLPDPTAMRDFLRYAFTGWSVKPKYVLFFGDATYDMKNIHGDDRWWVPTYQTVESNSKISTYSIEDFFAYLDPLAIYTVSIAHGRLCPRSAAEARVMVDRIIAYEKNPVLSNWKNLITIVADDLYSTDSSNETFNTVDSETLANSKTPKDFEIRRIYTEEFPLTYASSGRRRPEARQAIIDQVNRGTLILNYAGHGNPKVWAHESILTLEDVKTQFTNADKLTFIVAATCDWGRFDEGTEQSSAEEAMIAGGGGAIGVLSATRAVYADDNADLNQQFYMHLFSGSPVLTLGDALLLTKNDPQVTALDGKQKFFLLGDPTLRLSVPRGKISIDSINGRATVELDTLSALEKTTIIATVRDSANGIMTGYSGKALVTVFDSETDKKIPGLPPYKQAGTVIYRGEASITGGRLSASFIVPKDILYENKIGRMSIYFSGASDDGRGYTSNFIVGGTNAVAAVDSAGPSITVYFDSPSFRSGDLVGSEPTLMVELRDSSGINSSGSAIGHRIEAWIDNNTKSIDLTDSYRGKIDSYQAGIVEHPLTGLSSGSHSIKVRAWDAYNNSSMAEAYFSVASSDGLSIQQLYNFPNPVSTTTAFTFQHNQTIPVDVTISIYTVAGRLIHKIERFALSDRFVSIPWDRRDTDGDEIGNGVYFYRVTARTIDGRFSSESLGKMAVVR